MRGRRKLREATPLWGGRAPASTSPPCSLPPSPPVTPTFLPSRCAAPPPPPPPHAHLDCFRVKHITDGDAVHVAVAGHHLDVDDEHLDGGGLDLREGTQEEAEWRQAEGGLAGEQRRVDGGSGLGRLEKDTERSRPPARMPPPCACHYARMARPMHAIKPGWPAPCMDHACTCMMHREPSSPMRMTSTNRYRPCA